MSNIKELKAVQAAKKVTYFDSVSAHLADLDDEEKNAECAILLTVGVTTLGAVYTVLEGNNILEVIGLLDSIKQFIVQEYL